MSTQAELLAYAAKDHASALEVVAKLLSVTPTAPVTAGSSVQDILGLITGVQSPLAGEIAELPDIGGKVSGSKLDELIKKLGK